MDKTPVLVLIGGISQHSLNQRLYRAFERLTPPDFQNGFFLETFEIQSLPFYSQDLELNPPQIVREFQRKVEEAGAYLFVTPEYNRSFPGVLKNAIDWASRPYGENRWFGKPAGLIGASAGNIGTFGAQHHLRQVFAYLNLKVMTHPELYLNGSRALDEKGGVRDPAVTELLKDFWKEYHQWIAFGGEVGRLGLTG